MPRIRNSVERWDVLFLIDDSKPFAWFCDLIKFLLTLWYISRTEAKKSIKSCKLLNLLRIFHCTGLFNSIWQGTAVCFCVLIVSSSSFAAARAGVTQRSPSSSGPKYNRDINQTMHKTWSNLLKISERFNGTFSLPLRYCFTVRILCSKKILRQEECSPPRRHSLGFVMRSSPTKESVSHQFETQGSKYFQMKK